LLGLAEPLTDEGQDEVLFSFQMIVVLNSEGDNVTQHLALQARREGHLGRDGLQGRRQCAKEGCQTLVFCLIVLYYWPRG